MLGPTPSCRQTSTSLIPQSFSRGPVAWNNSVLPMVQQLRMQLPIMFHEPTQHDLAKPLRSLVIRLFGFYSSYFRALTPLGGQFQDDPVGFWFMTEKRARKKSKQVAIFGRRGLAGAAMFLWLSVLF